MPEFEEMNDEFAFNDTKNEEEKGEFSAKNKVNFFIDPISNKVQYRTEEPICSLLTEVGRYYVKLFYYVMLRKVKGS